MCTRHTIFAEALCVSCYPSVIHRPRGKETGFANRAIEKEQVMNSIFILLKGNLQS